MKDEEEDGGRRKKGLHILGHVSTVFLIALVIPSGSTYNTMRGGRRLSPFTLARALSLSLCRIFLSPSFPLHLSLFSLSSHLLRAGRCQQGHRCHLRRLCFLPRQFLQLVRQLVVRLIRRGGDVFARLLLCWIATNKGGRSRPASSTLPATPPGGLALALACRPGKAGRDAPTPGGGAVVPGKETNDGRKNERMKE